MSHFLFVDDRGEVLGVWVATDEVSAVRLCVHLALMYPECKTVADRAASFDQLKAEYEEYDFSGLVPEESIAV